MVPSPDRSSKIKRMWVQYFAISVLLILERLPFSRIDKIPPFRPRNRLTLWYFAQNHLISLAATGLLAILFMTGAFPYAPRSTIPAILEYAIVLVIADASIYVVHFAGHNLPFWWKVHRAHHSMRALDGITALHLHILEQLLTSALYVASCYLFVVVLRWPPLPVLWAYFTKGFWAMVIHSNVNISRKHWPGKLLGAVFMLPDTHRLHHMAAYEQMNIGNALTIWDRIRGTYMLPGSAPSQVIGYPEETNYFKSFREQLLFPFRPYKPDSGR